MVEVPVRDQDRVGAADLGERPGPKQMSRSAAENGIGEQRDAVELDQRARVAEVGDLPLAQRGSPSSAAGGC